MLVILKIECKETNYSIHMKEKKIPMWIFSMICYCGGVIDGMEILWLQFKNKHELYTFIF